MNNKILSTLLTAGMTVALTACVSYPSVGSQQADTPPRIVVKNDKNVWNDAGLFGPVPAELAVDAQRVCSSLDTDKVKHEAQGYHAKAEDVNGKPFPNGGYYCVPKN